MNINSVGGFQNNRFDSIGNSRPPKPQPPSSDDLFNKLSSMTGVNESGDIDKSKFEEFFNKLDASSPHKKPLQDLKAKFDQIAGEDGSISKVEFKNALESGVLKGPQPPQPELTRPSFRSDLNSTWDFLNPKDLTKEQLTPPIDFKI